MHYPDSLRRPIVQASYEGNYYHKDEWTVCQWKGNESRVVGTSYIYSTDRRDHSTSLSNSNYLGVTTRVIDDERQLHSFTLCVAKKEESML